MSIDEIDFTHHALAQLGTDTRWRVWRQNCGEIPVRDRSGKVVRVFHPGPPNGAADISGIVREGGWRLEVELKMPKGKRSKAQVAWAKMVEGLHDAAIRIQSDVPVFVVAGQAGSLIRSDGLPAVPAFDGIRDRLLFVITACAVLDRLLGAVDVLHILIINARTLEFVPGLKNCF
jgi:hypothetical protein